MKIGRYIRYGFSVLSSLALFACDMTGATLVGACKGAVEKWPGEWLLFTTAMKDTHARFKASGAAT